MFIGDRIGMDLAIVKLAEITNVIPVKEFDDGEESGYEVVDAGSTNLMAVNVKDEDGKDIVIIIDKENTAGINNLIDLL